MRYYSRFYPLFMPRRRESALDPTLSRGIIVIILVISALIIGLSFFHRAGAVGIALDEYVLSFLFGVMRYASPFVILLIAWFLVKDVEYNYRPTHGLGAFLFFVSLSSLFHLKFDPALMWREALSGHGGGIFGLFAWVLKTYLGSIGGIIVLVGLALVSVILMFNTSVTAFILLHRKLFTGLGAGGVALVNGVKKLFVKNPGQVQFRIRGDYAVAAEEEQDSAEETPTATERAFQKKSLAPERAENEDDDGEMDEQTDSEDTKRPNRPDVWAKKVVIRQLPPLDLLSDKRSKPTSGDIEANAEIIKDTFEQFGIDVEMGEVRVGPTVTQYTLKPAKGVKLSRITGLSNDLALSLAAHPIRIEAPIPGKSLVGVEVPNQRTALVSLKELLEDKNFKLRPHNLMLALGKDVAGKVWFADLPKMPHLLVAGATGSGKTVCVNAVIMGLLYQNTAETLRLIMVDPKRVELTLYNGIPHLLTPVITNVQKTVNALKWTIGEMERRFEVLATAGSRDITSYNQKNPENKLPHIVFIIDELADLMASAANEVEAGIIRLAQMARAVGIHLVLATQRPSVDVITGLMKANIPARIAFSVASIIDSRTILDCPGAEKLLGRGDMLFSSAELSKPVRIQGAYVSEEELKRLSEYLKGDEEPEYDESIVGQAGNNGTMSLFGGPSDDQDPLFNETKNYVIQAGKASASLMQRRFKIGYARAARILDELEAAGIVGPADGAKPREILVTIGAGNDTMDSGQELNVFTDADSESQEEKPGQL
ncbi:MAG: translocase FtsK protein [Candidatus Magasanikbacteria bacterium GW2011_GWA2_56_11]|uniref:Translocase FtsK protein n=1 Tax=Candidatus Magasanikbacteria bacterium GW2011_GWA2_56_11 TaxID=1619044 RepID=A0A0G2BBA3_9BACT|nr:MAG: translocase FtsK protein [Candidatus Magasanikbacteria bacterium GW2011_GWA2_56_11]